MSSSGRPPLSEVPTNQHPLAGNDPESVSTAGPHHKPSTDVHKDDVSVRPPAGLLSYLERSSYGVFKDALDSVGLGDGIPQDLPCIVAIGEESAGKSATLERITMLPVFPKAEDFCTKMPVRIRMTHTPKGPKSCRIFFPASQYGLGKCMVDVEESLDLDLCDNPSAVVQKVMDGIHANYAKETGKDKCVVPHELIIDISSKDVPTIEMVDLPGIREAPEGLRRATKDLAYKYASKKETLILCVVPATSPRLESSQAMGIVQELGRSDRTVCVLTKCDEINVAKEVQLKKMVQRLMNLSNEHNLACVVGIKNRDTCEENEENEGKEEVGEDEGKVNEKEEGRLPPLTILNMKDDESCDDSEYLPGEAELQEATTDGEEDEDDEAMDVVDEAFVIDDVAVPPNAEMRRMLESLDAEQEWFQKWVPGVSLEDHVSLHALIRSLDHLMCEHIRSTWIPGACALVKETQVEVAGQLKALGCDMDEAKEETAKAEFANLAALVIEDCVAKIDAILAKDSGTLGSSAGDYAIRAGVSPCMATMKQLQDEEEAWPTTQAVVESLGTEQMLKELAALVTETLAAHFGPVKPSCCVDQVRGLDQVWAKWLKGDTAKPAAEDKENARKAVSAFNWGRFGNLKASLDAAILKYVSHKFTSAAAPSIEAFVRHFVESYSPATSLKERLPWLKYNCKVVVIRKVLVPLLKEETFSKLLGLLAGVDGGLGRLLEEDDEYKSHRADLSERLTKIQESLRMLGVVSGQMDDHGDGLADNK